MATRQHYAITVFILIASSFLIGCGGNDNPLDPSEAIIGTWELVQMTDHGITFFAGVPTRDRNGVLYTYSGTATFNKSTYTTTTTAEFRNEANELITRTETESGSYIVNDNILVLTDSGGSRKDVPFMIKDNKLTFTQDGEQVIFKRK